MKLWHLFRKQDCPAPAPPPRQLEKRLLVIADTHGHLSYSDPLRLLPVIASGKAADIVCFLGDHDIRDLARILPMLEGKRCLGVPGNHDASDIYDALPIENIHGRVIEVAGIRIAGFGGCPRYKNDMRYALYAEDEASACLEQLPAADIFLSHANPFDKEAAACGDVAHAGFLAIDHYIARTRPACHLYGHLHKNSDYTDASGCRHICTYGARLVSV